MRRLAFHPDTFLWYKGGSKAFNRNSQIKMFPVLQSIFEAQNASNATRLTTSNTTIDTADIWKNPLIFSTYLSLASALLLLLHAIILYGRPLWTSITTGPSASTSDENLGNSESSLSSRIRRQIGVLGGRAVLGWKAIRAVGCLALFTLSVFSLVTDDQATLKWNTGLTGSETIYTGGCITFVSPSSSSLDSHILTVLQNIRHMPRFWRSCPYSLDHVVVGSSLITSRLYSSFHSLSMSIEIYGPWQLSQSIPSISAKDGFCGLRSQFLGLSGWSFLCSSPDNMCP